MYSGGNALKRDSLFKTKHLMFENYFFNLKEKNKS